MRFLTAGYGGTVPYAVSITDVPHAAAILGFNGPFEAGDEMDPKYISVYWTQAYDGAQAVDASQVGIAYGAATPGDTSDLMIAGVINADVALSSTAASDTTVTRDIPITYSIPADVDVWVVFVATPTDEEHPPRIDGASVLDKAAAGCAMVAPAETVLVPGQTVTFTPLRGYNCRPASVAVVVA